MSNADPSATRLSAVILGQESLLIQCAEHFLGRGHELLAVVSSTPQIIGWAEKKGLRVEAPGKDLGARLAGLSPDYLLSVTNLSILPDDVLALPTKGSINFHDGPLPAYAGMYTPVWALLHGESSYGITFHQIAGGVDEGDILVQKRFDMDPGETSLSLNTKNYGAAIEAFGELVLALESGSPATTAQDLSKRSYFGRYERPEAACVIDLGAPAETIERLVRALDFGRYENPVGTPKLMHKGQAVGVGSATLEPAGDGVEEGTLLEVTPEGLRVGAKQGVLVLSRLSTLAGDELSAAQAAQQLGIRGGERFEQPSAEQRAQLTELNAQLSRAETKWAKQLSTLDALEVPYLRPENTAQGDAQHQRLDVPVPAGFTVDGKSRADAVLLGAALYLARLGGRESFDVTLADPAIAERGGDVARALLYANVPFRASLPGAELSVQDGLARLSDTLERCRERGPFLRELTLRYPPLHDKVDLREGRLLPIALSVGDHAATPAGALLNFEVAPDGSRLTLDYDARALSAEHAAEMARQIETLLTACTEDASQPLRKLPLMDAAQRQKVLLEWNATQKDYDRDATIVSLFEAQAKKTPDAKAVTCEGASLTYAELDAKASALGAHLVSLGLGPDRMAGVYVERSVEMLIAMLGIMKAGGAYLPLDPAYPGDRIAFMIEDSNVPVVVTQASLAPKLPSGGAKAVVIDRDWESIQQAGEITTGAASADHLAYVIYTSGSTGKPKGVQVEHRNAVNFFEGMDDRIGEDSPGTWLAVTSLSFDISVLELLWTLTRGFHVVLYVDRTGSAKSGGARQGGKPVDFGIFLWGNDAGPGRGKYELMLESAKFADENGFTFVSTPERHFHSFGGPFPNPSVTGAALAVTTKNVQIRSGSCVVPLHHPIRVAEEWAVIDNLSEGRVGLSFAAGWQPNDFVIRKEGFKDAKKKMFESIETVKKLWRGETLEFENPLGDMVPIATLPRPVQAELPTWVTTAGNVETYKQAGRAGANVLTHLLGQTVDQVAEKVQAYRDARAEAGLDPNTGVVTLMLHTYVGKNDDEVREIVKGPMKSYLGSSVALIKGFAWSFPAFRRPEGVSETDDVGLDHLTDDEMDALLDHAFDRYYESSGLFGTVDRCVEMVERVRQAGIDEIACLVDYGVPNQLVRDSLPLLAQVRGISAAPAREVPEGDFSIPALVAEHGVTHFQCTPSMAKMLTLQDETRKAVGAIKHMMVGGEALPLSLAQSLNELGLTSLTNMYGPTETTIWSSTQRVAKDAAAVYIGTPIANTQLYVVDGYGQPTPPGVAGELWIAGDGVVRGYYERPELNAERFVPDTLTGEGTDKRAYRTGDLARYLPDGTVEFLGRLDFQVKIRGYRIELGEVEAVLTRQPGVRECVVVAQPDPSGDKRLCAYFVADGAPPSDDTLRAGMRKNLPEFMLPSVFASLPALPLTPNGKVDRKALPSPESLAQRASKAAESAPENEVEQRIAEIWKKFLGIATVSREDNFFDLGGHSLLVVQVHRVLKEEIDASLSLTDLYRSPTIASLAARLSGTDTNESVDQARDRGAERRKAMQARRRARR